MYKNIFTSKTFIVACLQGILGIIVAVNSIQPELGQIMIVKSIIDITLRYVTESPVKIFND